MRLRSTRRVQDLSRTEKSLVAIARALAVEADVLVLDEPTASLPADEVERMFRVLRQLSQRGVGMIYVSHRLDEIFRLADRVAVLRDGRLVGVQPVKATTPYELVNMIVGREVKELYRPRHAGARARNAAGCRSLDLRCRAGELSPPATAKCSVWLACAVPARRPLAVRCSVPREPRHCHA